LYGRSRTQEPRLISIVMKVVLREIVLQKHFIRNKRKSLHILHITSGFLIFISPPSEAHPQTCSDYETRCHSRSLFCNLQDCEDAERYLLTLTLLLLLLLLLLLEHQSRRYFLKSRKKTLPWPFKKVTSVHSLLYEREWKLHASNF
jgi:hypothetical protein